jgi:predicted nucleotide-binding protein
MARKTPPAPELPLYLAVSREDAAQRIADRIKRGTELKARPISAKQILDQVQRDYWTWSEYNEEMLRRMFTTPKIAEEYSESFGAFVAGGQYYLQEEIDDLHKSIDAKSRRLASITERLELIPLAPGVGQTQGASVATAPGASDQVFLVHGHDEATRESVARFIAKLGLDPVILHEQASQGRTIVEKLEHHGNVGYAIVLLTPDDVGGENEKDLRPRARQNVVLELGYFVGRLGRQRVCAIHRGKLELPSDYMGVIYVPFDSNGGWRLLLARELRAAGFPVDMNKAV